MLCYGVDYGSISLPLCIYAVSESPLPISTDNHYIQRLNPVEITLSGTEQYTVSVADQEHGPYRLILSKPAVQISASRSASLGFAQLREVKQTIPLPPIALNGPLRRGLAWPGPMERIPVPAQYHGTAP